MQTGTLRSVLVAAACLCSALALSPAANAAFTAPGSDSGTILVPLDDPDYPFGSATTSFDVVTGGLYEITLTDLGFGSNPFGALQATVSIVDGGLHQIGQLTLDGSTASVSDSFTLDVGTYSALLEAEVSGTSGDWKLEVTAVPLPASVILLGSALIGLGVIGRTRKGSPDVSSHAPVTPDEVS
jgi:hypothetical protein